MALIAAKAHRPQGSVLEEIVDCLRLMLGTAFAYAWELRALTSDSILDTDRVESAITLFASVAERLCKNRRIQKEL